MSEDHRENLEDLSDDLAEAATEGHDAAEDLHGSVNDYLSSSEPSVEEHDALTDQLSEAVLHFEVSHPSLSAAVQRAIDSLTASGI